MPLIRPDQALLPAHSPCPPPGPTRVVTWSLLLMLLALSQGCSPSSSTSSTASGTPHSAQARLQVLATTGMIADAARIVGGEHVEVVALMGPGVDPHLYQPTARDQAKLSAARLILYNGLHLEGKMGEIFESLARTKTIVAVSRDIPPAKLLSWGDAEGLHDPHIWFDVQLWKQVVETITQAYIKDDPTHAESYRERSDKYQQELAQLDAYCRARAAELLPEQRVLITSHDAFHYFGKAYGFEVVGIQGISTESEAGLKAITDAVDLIKQRKIRAIFPETSVKPAAIQRVAQDSGAQLGPELYSDALGGPETPAATYVGMIRTNIDNIVTALRPAP